VQQTVKYFAKRPLHAYSEICLWVGGDQWRDPPTTGTVFPAFRTGQRQSSTSTHITKCNSSQGTYTN